MDAIEVRLGGMRRARINGRLYEGSREQGYSAHPRDGLTDGIYLNRDDVVSFLRTWATESIEPGERQRITLAANVIERTGV